ncbi:MAG: hypothetical protein AAF577_09160 [Pseudomonadota bacterium]
MNAGAADGGNQGRGWLIIVGVILVVALLALVFLNTTERQVRRSPIGFDGLAVWLRDQDQAAVTQSGLTRVDPTEVGLRILPLFDAVLDADRESASTEEEMLYRLSDVDMQTRIVREKIDRLPTLVVLHKWRTGMRLTRIAHPVLFGSARHQTRVLADIAPGLGRVKLLPQLFTPFRLAPDARIDDEPEGIAELYLPQVISGADACRPIIGTADAMILGRCVTGDKRADETVRHFWLLSDPDLLNNHGLTLGDNAVLASRLMAHMAGDGLTVVDYTDYVWAVGPRPRREREWSDLLRFFEWPFTILWLGFGVVTALLLWRASVRDAAPLPAGDQGPGATKTVSIDAQARLMRLSGADGALLEAYVSQRLGMLADELIGPRRSGTDALRTIFGVLERRGVGTAGAFKTAVVGARSLSSNAPAAQVVDHLDRFETALEQVMHELGRSSRNG